MASQGTHMYFILIKKPKNIGIINAGSICYISENRYTSILRRKDGTLTKLPMLRIGGSYLDHELDISDMEPLTIQEVELLLALKDESERLKWFIEKETLQTALGLAVNTSVTLEEKGESLKGIIRCICRLTAPEGSTGLSAIFFGIELQGKDKGKGTNDGTYKFKTFFKCPRDCGVMAPFSKVRPVVYRSLSPSEPLLSPQAQAETLALGDRVTFMFDEDHFGHGMVMDVGEKDGQQMVRLSTDKDKNGVRGGDTEVPLNCVFKVKEEVYPAGLEPERMDTDAPLAVPALDTHPMDLGVDSMVEVSLATGNTYGIIRWVGTLPGREETMAGLELEDNIGVSDGTFKNERFFQCPPGKALFIKLLSCRPDSRFQNQSANCERQKKVSPERERKQSGGMPGNPIAPITTDRVTEVLIGQMKGIQGHCNSCYMDATLFSLFSCSSVLDSLLFMSTEPRDAHIQGTLLYDIVNPLRSEGFVEGKHVMKLRQQLQEHGYSRTFTTDEKDPEEFLTVIMHHILALEPLLKLSAGGKVQESYCYQIFLEQNHSLVLPTVQQLLEHSFHSAGLKLAEVPSCLILQMPRFGKKFKMFDKIIPSLELDITDLLSEGPQQCTLCGQLACEECVDCFKDPLFGQTGFKLFCHTCSSQVHAHPQRRDHRPTRLDMPKGFPGHNGPQVLARDKLELFAVLCIETSHYVSFIKHGPNNHDWIFFDSMADRHGGIDGFNIPQVHACPEVGAYLEMSPAELANHAPRDMKGVAKRLFCDAYMYLYQSTTMCLYR